MVWQRKVVRQSRASEIVVEFILVIFMFERDDQRLTSEGDFVSFSCLKGRNISYCNFKG